MTIRILIILTLFSISLAQSGFTQIVRDDVNLADEAFKDGDYYLASTYYYKALQKDTTILDIAYKYAESCRLFNDYKEAAKWYEYVARKDEKGKFPLSVFYQGLMLKNSGRYEEAKTAFSKYYDDHRLDRDYFSKKANLEIQACDFAMEKIKDPLDVNIEHLGDEINTPYSEFGALQLKDSLLVFSSLRYISSDEPLPVTPEIYQSKIYSSVIENETYEKPGSLGPFINQQDIHTANICFTRDHKTAYFTKCKAIDYSGLRCEIFKSSLKDGEWQKPEKLDKSINLQGYTATHPFIVEDEDEDILYFVSDRPEGQGNLDIWYSRIRRDKYYGPYNAGRTVNSPGNEITPFYHYPTKTLYFSSDWHTGLGGFDIFHSAGDVRKREDIENIGYPLNSSCNDIYFTINSDDSTGYFTSNRPGSFYIEGETCCNDIYFYDWRDRPEPIDSLIIAIDTTDIEQTVKQLLPLTLYFHNDEPDPKTTKTKTKQNYEDVLKSYFSLKNKYIKEYSRGLTGKEKEQAQQEIEDFFDNEVGQGFDNLKEFARLLLKDLRKGSKVEITIKGYTSPLNTKEYNINLAKRRISSLKNFIYEYNDGVFKKYLSTHSNGEAMLEIHEEPIGEEQASSEVSDNPNDIRNAVYSRAAARERRIQIIMYSSEFNGTDADASLTTDVIISPDFLDFGQVTFGDQVSQYLEITNIGDNDLVIYNIEPSCGCTIFDLPEGPIRPGETVSIKVFFDAHDTLGEQNEFLSISLNNDEGNLTVFIGAFVVEK